MQKRTHILSVAAVLVLGATSLVGCVSAGDGKAGISVGSDGAVISAPGVTVSGGSEGAKVEASDATVSAGSDGAAVDAGEGTDAAEASGASSPEATGSAETSATTGDSGDADSPLPLHIGWEALVTEEVECAGGVATVETTGSIVKLLQPCDKVVVEATGATLVLTQPVRSLQISGSGNTAAGVSLTAVDINGTGNTVAYAGAKPNVQDEGTGNVVSDAQLTLPGAAG